MKHKISKIVFTGITLLSPLLTLAQSGGGTTVNPTRIYIENPTKAGNDLMSVLTKLLSDVVMPVAAVLVVMYIIYAGFTFLTAQGKPAEIEKAKSRIFWALIGAGILLGASAIALLVKNTVEALMP